MKAMDLILSSGTEGIGISDKGKVIFANDQLAKMLGHKNPSEIIGQPVSQYVAPRSLQLVMDNMAKGISIPYESFSRKIDGTEFPTITFARPVEFMGKKVRVTTIRDITKQYNSRVQLETSESLYETLFNQIPITVWNEDASELLEFASETGLDKIENLQEYLHKNPEIVRQAFSKLRIIDVNATAVELLAVQSKEMLINSFPDFFTDKTLQTFSYSMTAMIKRDRSFEIESEFLTARGKIIDIHVYWRVQPGHEEDYSRIVTVISDISERKKAEAERLKMESRFEQMQKLESLGIFAGGIADDFSDLIEGINYNVTLALSKMDPASPVFTMIETIKEISLEASNLTKQLHAYSGRVKISKELFNLNDLINEMKEFIDLQLPEGFTIDYRLSPTEPWIEADRTLVRQMIINLLNNAIDVLSDDGVITISTNHVVRENLDEAPGQMIFQPIESSFYSCLGISDNGTGISDKIIKKIFDPFYSSKSEGSGLGLSVVQGIIQGHEAGLILDAEVDVGSTFRILFPQITDYEKVKNLIE